MASLPTVTVIGGDLFRLAAQQFGDATQAIRIAQRNGLEDFFLSGAVTLTMPPAGGATGGVPEQ